jgi:hypothetical protein
MNKAILTVVVADTTSASVLEALKDANVGVVQVLNQGDIRVSDKDLAQLPTEVWLFEPRTGFFVAAHDGDTGGRALTLDEVQVLTEFGVCLEMTGTYPNAVVHGTPEYAVHVEAAQAEVTCLGFEVPADGFKVSVKDCPDGSGQRWFRVAMPAWFNLKL